MQVLVVYAHPAQESLSAALFATATAALKRNGHAVDVIDLYGEDFEARMSRAERLAYETNTPMLDPMVQRHAAMLVRAQVLVFVYPTWYWGLPAILKGWLERTLVPGVGFVLDARTNKVRGGLSGLRRIVGISTSDRATWKRWPWRTTVGGSSCAASGCWHRHFVVAPPGWGSMASTGLAPNTSNASSGKLTQPWAHCETRRCSTSVVDSGPSGSRESVADRW